MSTLTWHFSRFLRDKLPGQCGRAHPDPEAIDREARRLAQQFAQDMQQYFRQTLSDSYEGLENLSPDGIVDLYVQENLEDFEDDYLRNHLPGFYAVCERVFPSASLAPGVSHPGVCGEPSVGAVGDRLH